MGNKEIAELLFPGVKTKPEITEEKIGKLNMTSSFSLPANRLISFEDILVLIINLLIAMSSDSKFILILKTGDDFLLQNLNLLSGMGLEVRKNDYIEIVEDMSKEYCQNYTKKLIESDLAYPCFCSEQELNKIYKAQEIRNKQKGYYGRWTICRPLNLLNIKEKVGKGDSFRVRIKSEGIEDYEIIDKEGNPTALFASIVNSIHYKVKYLFINQNDTVKLDDIKAIYKEFTNITPKIIEYHITPKDEANEVITSEVVYKKGLPLDSLIEYLLASLNKDYLNWRKKEINKEFFSYKINIDKISKINLEYNLKDLDEHSRNAISRLDSSILFDLIFNWSMLFDKEFYQYLLDDKDKVIEALNIDRTGKERRKDIVFYSDLRSQFDYFFNDLYNSLPNSYPTRINGYDAIEFLNKYISLYSVKDSKDAWLRKVKQINISDFKIGDSVEHLREYTDLLRLVITKKINSPDLYLISKILGKSEIERRVSLAIDYFKGQDLIIHKLIKSSIFIENISALIGDYRMMSKNYVKEYLYPQVANIYSSVKNGFFISTCLRAEIYEFDVEKIAINDNFYYGEGKVLIKRLLNTLCGLNSEILGEREILNQTRDSILKAEELKKLKPSTAEFLFELIEIAEDLRDEFKLNCLDNYSTIGARLVEEKIDWKAMPTVMIIGGGYMADSFLNYAGKNIKKLIWINRDLQKVKNKANKLKDIDKSKIIFQEFERCNEFLPLADIIFVAVNGKPDHFTEDDIKMLPENAYVVDVSYPNVFANSNLRKITNISNTNFGELVVNKITKEQINAVQRRIDLIVNG